MKDCCCYWVLVLAGRKGALPWQQRVNVCWCMLTCRRRPQRQPSSTRHLVTSYGGDEEEMLPLEPDIGKLNRLFQSLKPTLVSLIALAGKLES